MDFFEDPKSGTGGRFPYGFFIDQQGVIYQCAKLSISTPGAGAKANRAAIQIALDGDFRTKAPSEAQLAALKELCAALQTWNPTLKIEGHTEQPGRSADPKKVCPGKKLDVNGLRVSLLELRERKAKEALKVAGVQF